MPSSGFATDLPLEGTAAVGHRTPSQLLVRLVIERPHVKWKLSFGLGFDDKARRSVLPAKTRWQIDWNAFFLVQRSSTRGFDGGFGATPDGA
ncbi:hypothetical protein MPC1_13280002 [Methylocella tundrae]|nr:hypothetical protein MPC1_13280002 [Methylocella tundrae]